MRPFHVLVGPNASGKSAFLDVLMFLHDFIHDDLDHAVRKRTGNFFDLVWGRGETEKGFEIAVEAEVPNELFDSEEKGMAQIIRYELKVIFDKDANEYFVDKEHIFYPNPSECVMKSDNSIQNLITNITKLRQPYAAREASETSEMHGSCLVHKNGKRIRVVIPNKRKRSILPYICDYNEFLAIMKYVIARINFYYFDPFIMRRECPPGSGEYMKPDGSNLPWVIDDLKNKNPELFTEWLKHIQTALPNLEDIRAFRRPEDGFCFLMFKYANRPEIPSWAVSDGTLRLLSLTLPVYLPDPQGIYMFEEPENGIHPQAIETVMDSMKSFYHGQVLLTTHSPLILSLVKPEEILCFSNQPEKGTRIIPGDKHPVLQEWQKNKETGLGVLFGSGIFDSEWGDDERSDCADVG
jgi:predicted ATPase